MPPADAVHGEILNAAATGASTTVTWTTAVVCARTGGGGINTLPVKIMSMTRRHITQATLTVCAESVVSVSGADTQ